MELYGQAYYDHYGPIPYDRANGWFPAFFRNVAQQIATRLRPGSVMDVGCAKGFLVEALRDLGIAACGIDVSAYAISQVRPDLQPWCRVASATEPLDARYDLITCIEVAEHLSAPDVRLALDNICGHADAVLFSSTPEDHYEPTHIHVRPRSYWISCFEARGFTVDRGIDAAFLTPWATLFRRTGRPAYRLAYYAFGSPSSACNLVRVTGPASHLARQGRAVLLRGCRPADSGCAVDLDVLNTADLVLMQREFPCHPASEAVIAEARRRSLPVVYELDDLLPDVPPEHPEAGRFRTAAERLRSVMRAADAVTVPSLQLRAEALAWNPCVRVLPNYLDDNVWQIVDRPEAAEVVTIGYAGTPTHEPDLDTIRDALQSVAARYGRRVRFRFLGARPEWARALPGSDPGEPLLEDYRWDYPRALARSGIDIGLAPLRPSRFNRAKSHIKYLEYAAAGIAGVYADLPPYGRTVRDGATGLLVPGDTEHWYAAICALIEDPGRRADMVRRAQEDVRHNWLLSRNVDRWYDAYASLAGRSRGGPRVAPAPSPRRPVVSIVIPVHGQWPYTARCLEHLAKHTGPVAYEVVIVDNGSEDETPTALQALPDRVHVMTNATNESFARACNRGAGAARGQFLVFMNNDVEAQPDWLRPLLDVAESDPAVAAAGSRLLFPDGSIQHAGVEIRYAAPYPICPAHIGYRQPDRGMEGPAEVSAVTGACMLVRADRFAAVGGFDERYENGYEDVDLCLKLREAGWRIVYVPESRLVHHEATTPGRHLKERENLDLLHRTWMDRLTRFDRDDHAHARPAEGGSDRPGVSIIVVTYDSLATVAPCLERLRVHTRPQDEVIVVDNASRDATAVFLRWFEARHPDRLRVLCNERNLGFARAVNVGLREARREIVCLLNPDVMVTAGWLDRMAVHLTNNPDVGAVGPVSDYVAGLQKVDLYLDDGSGRDADARAALVRERHAGRTVDTALLIGFCLMLRRSDLTAAGGLDGDLYLGHDDLDLCLRLRRRGCRLLVAVDVFVHHEGHVSFSGDPARGMYLVQQSANALYEKLHRAYRGSVPTGRELWGIDWFRPTTGLTSIICLVHDNLDLTRQCIASVYEHTGRDFELILVDNGSRGEVAAFADGLSQAHGNVVQVRNTENEGYAYGCNQGLSLARGEFIVLLNNDTVVTAQWLNRLLALLTLHESIGIVGPRSNYCAGAQQVENVTYDGMAGLPDFADRWFETHAGRFTSVPRVVGVCLAMRRSVCERIGGFDTAFGRGNFEDDDFCLRAMLAGFRIAVADDVFIHHHGSATFRAIGAPYAELMAENWETFRGKWLLGRGLPDAPQAAGGPAFDERWDHIPCCYEEIFRPGVEPLHPHPRRTISLLCVPDWNGGAWRPIVEAYVRAFGGADPVSLLLRVEPPLPEVVDRAQRQVADLLAALRGSEGAGPDIRWETTQIPPRLRGSLYASASALLPCAGSRADLYLREARACGLPVVDPVTVPALRRLIRSEG